MKKKIIIALLAASIMTFSLCACSDSGTETSDTTVKTTTEETKAAKADPTDKYTTEEKNCWKSAMSYLDMSGFSKAGLIDQLSSEYGEGYPKDTAKKVVNDIEKAGKVNWVDEAKESAENYLDTSSFSKDGLIEQLTSEYGEQFTQKQAEKAVEAVYK